MSETFEREGSSDNIIRTQDRYDPATGESSTPAVTTHTVAVTEAEVASLEAELSDARALLVNLQAVPMPPPEPEPPTT